MFFDPEYFQVMALSLVVMRNYLEIFDDSFQRVVANRINGRDFFERFYEIFLTSSPEVAEKFKNTDMGTQKLMLRQSISFMINFSTTHQTNEYLDRIAAIHSKAQFDIRPALYDLWLDCLIQTVNEFDDHFNTHVTLAWRIVLSPGITFMKFHYAK